MPEQQERDLIPTRRRRQRQCGPTRTDARDNNAVVESHLDNSGGSAGDAGECVRAEVVSGQGEEAETRG